MNGLGNQLDMCEGERGIEADFWVSCIYKDMTENAEGAPGLGTSHGLVLGMWPLRCFRGFPEKSLEACWVFPTRSSGEILAR